MDSASCDSGIASSSKTSLDEGISNEDDRGMCGLTDLVSSCLTKPRPSRETEPFLWASLFTGVPPCIRFYTKGTKVRKPKKRITTRLQWCNNSLLPIVIRQTLSTSYFTIVDESLFYIGYWGRHLKSAKYRTMKPYQKINHYPGAFHIGRKDRLWQYISSQARIFGEEYEIMPKTYILPAEKNELTAYLEADPNHHVIVKPPASARGDGITVTRRMKDIPLKTAVIAQHYVDRPLLINEAKFDLRFYAYCPSLEPLRIYIYDQGLVRFASIPYSNCTTTVSNKYMHLTNYSINKLAEKDGVSDSPVPKWRLTELWDYFESHEIDSEAVLRRIEDVIIKAFIASESPIRKHMAHFVKQGFICHELFGVDILLDEDLRPWLLEINISPSLHSGTPLDISVKAPLAKDVLNLAGIYVPPEEHECEASTYSTRPRNGERDDEQITKETAWLNVYREEGEVNNRILKHLTPEDTRYLVEFEDELRRRGNFRLAFPTAYTSQMQRYFVEPVYANLLLQQWQIEQENDRNIGISHLEKLCQDGIMDYDITAQYL